MNHRFWRQRSDEHDTYKCTKFLDSLEERAEFVDIEVVRSIVLKYCCTCSRKRLCCFGNWCYSVSFWALQWTVVCLFFVKTGYTRILTRCHPISLWSGKHLLRVWKVRGAYLGTKTNCSVGFPQSIQTTAGVVFRIWPRPLPSTFCPIHNSLIVPSDASNSVIW